MGLVLTEAPSVEPVTADDVRAQCRIDSSDESDLIEGYITSARAQVENDCRRALITQTWERTLDRFPHSCEPIYLARNPVQQVESITYVDPQGATQTLSTDVYQVDTKGAVARVGLKPGKSWPSTKCGLWNSVTITYVAGYGDTADDVPRGLRTAIAILAGHWFENREPIITGTIVSNIPIHFDRLLWPFSIKEAA